MTTTSEKRANGNLLRALARRFCGHGEMELRRLEQRTHNAEIQYARIRRLAGKAGRRAVAAERRNDPVAAALAAWERVSRRGPR